MHLILLKALHISYICQHWAAFVPQWLTECSWAHQVSRTSTRSISQNSNKSAMPFWPTQSNEKASLIQRFKSFVQWLPGLKTDSIRWSSLQPGKLSSRVCMHIIWNWYQAPLSPSSWNWVLCILCSWLACSVRVATVANKNTPFVIPLIHVPKQVS